MHPSVKKLLVSCLANDALLVMDEFRLLTDEDGRTVDSLDIEKRLIARMTSTLKIYTGKEGLGE